MLRNNVYEPLVVDFHRKIRMNMMRRKKIS